MEAANHVTATATPQTDHFASRFPHHKSFEEAAAVAAINGGLKKGKSKTATLQASNVVMAKVLVNNTNSLNALSEELSRFALKPSATSPLPPPTTSPVPVRSGDHQTTTKTSNNSATTIPYSNVPLSTTSSNNQVVSNRSSPHAEATAPAQRTEATDATPTAQVGATKKIPALQHRHLIPIIKAQSIEISEVRQVTQSLSEEEEYEPDGASDAPRGSTSSEPGGASIHGMISKIKSLDSMRPIYPNVPYSPYGSPFSSPRAYRRTTRPPLKESRRISIEQSGSFLQLNQYKLLEQIGQGSYGLVKLAYSEEDATHYAMKILSKKKLLRRAGLMGRGPKKAISPLDRVYREIAVLKKLDHPNVVKLVEVLDDPIDDSLYLVFELVKQGEVLSIPTEQPLSEERVWCIFRDVLLGLEYLHYQRIIHGDLKPGNLLLGECGQVKIADLGVCNEFIGEDASMNNGSSSGTPAFRAPETLKLGDHSYSGKAADIWALGATLYALIYGDVPFIASNIPALYEKIKNDPIHFPPTHTQHSPELKDLILRMLEKDPDKRITLAEIKEHPWVTANDNYRMPSEEENCRLIQVTDEELSSVVTSIPKLDTLILIKTMLKKHSFQNPFQKPMPRTSQRGVSRFERFRAGRSNSAPGAYHATLQKQFSTEILPSVIEGRVSESFKAADEEEPIPENEPQG